MQTGIRAAGGVLFAALVAAYGALAWREAEERALSAAEAEGRALLGAVTCGIDSSIAASSAVDELLGGRLVADARLVAATLAASPGIEEQVLSACVEEHGLAGAALLDTDFGTVASVEPSRGGGAPDSSNPFESGRLARLDMQSLVEQLRAAGLSSRPSVVLGFNEGPFAARTEFAVALAAPSLPGYVVLRADATRLDAFRSASGVAHVLRESARAPGIASLIVQDAGGTCLAADDPGLVGAVLPAPSARPQWTVRADGRRTLDLSAPVSWTGGRIGHLRVALDAAPVDAVVSESRRTIVVITTAAIVAGFGGLLALSSLERRRREAEARLREELSLRERFAAMGRLAAGVAHEIRGPLNALSLQTQLLSREAAHAAPERVAELTTSMRAAVGRVDAAVQEFLSLGRPGAAMSPRRTDLADVVARAIASEGGPLATQSPQSPVHVVCDAGLLAKAVSNLVRNARQSAPPGSVRVSWRREGAQALLDVDDAGPGVPAERRAEVFEPFRTARAGGTGLGLTIAKDAVERHGGRIEVLDAPGGGARFRVRLPADVAP